MTQRSAEERLVELEELFSHQQRFLQQLNDALIEIRGEVEQLRSGNNQHAESLRWLLKHVSEIEDSPDEKPPHY